MGVIIEAINVVMPVVAVAARLSPDHARLQALVPNNTLCTDGYLMRVGFMALLGVPVRS